MNKLEVPGKFDRAARGYDLLVGLNPGYHQALRRSARALGLRPGMRVLVVDDSLSARRNLVKRLATRGFMISEACDGLEALDQLRAGTYQLMITDLDMPRLDGFALLERIRGSREARIRTLPVVIISGNEGLESKNRALKLGANDFIGKSADAPEVMSRLDGVLRRHMRMPDGHLRDTVVYSILDSEWPMVRRNLDHRLDHGASA